MDSRESVPHLAAMIAAGLATSGVKVAFAGVITTPGVACVVRQDKFQAGVVISASHNPYHDNAVKVFSGAGMKLPDAEEEEIEAKIFRSPRRATPKNPPTTVTGETLAAESLKF